MGQSCPALGSGGEAGVPLSLRKELGGAGRDMAEAQLHADGKFDAIDGLTVGPRDAV